MFARILEFSAKMEKKDEIVKVVKNEILPILKKQNGFLEGTAAVSGNQERQNSGYQPVEREEGDGEI